MTPPEDLENAIYNHKVYRGWIRRYGVRDTEDWDHIWELLKRGRDVRVILLPSRHVNQGFDRDRVIWQGSCHWWLVPEKFLDFTGDSSSKEEKEIQDLDNIYPKAKGKKRSSEQSSVWVEKQGSKTLKMN